MWVVGPSWTAKEVLAITPAPSLTDVSGWGGGVGPHRTGVPSITRNTVDGSTIGVVARGTLGSPGIYTHTKVKRCKMDLRGGNKI